jgi:hypothetical protein
MKNLHLFLPYYLYVLEKGKLKTKFKKAANFSTKLFFLPKKTLHIIYFWAHQYTVIITA